MLCGGMESVIVMEKRHCALVYAVCGSVTDVDSAFDKLLMLIFSEKRERYFFGVLLDLAPAVVFRACGDGNIEERIKRRFEGLCDRVGRNGIFAFLRGRRYGIDRVYSCEGELRGALTELYSVLCGRDDDAFILKLGGFCERAENDINAVNRKWVESNEKDDRAVITDKVFVLRSDGRFENFFTETAFRFEKECSEIIFLPSSEKKHLFGEGYSSSRGRSKGRGDKSTSEGWLYFFQNAGANTEYIRTDELENIIFRGIAASKPKKSNKRAKFKKSIFASRRFNGLPEQNELDACIACVLNSLGIGGSGAEAREKIMRLSVRGEECSGAVIGELLLVFTAAFEFGRIDAFELCRLYDGVCDELEYLLTVGNCFSAYGFMRLALLLCASESERLGTMESCMYIACTRFKRAAELLRYKYERGDRNDKTLGACELAVFRCADILENNIGITVSFDFLDLFLLACASNETDEKRRKLLEVFNELNIDLSGIEINDTLFENSLAVCIASELRNNTFSRLFAASDELRVFSHTLDLLVDRQAFELRSLPSGSNFVRLYTRFDRQYAAIRSLGIVKQGFIYSGKSADLLPFTAFLQRFLSKKVHVLNGGDLVNDAVNRVRTVCIITKKLSFPLVRELMSAAEVLYALLYKNVFSTPFGTEADNKDDIAPFLTVITDDRCATLGLNSVKGAEIIFSPSTEKLDNLIKNSSFCRVVSENTSLFELIYQNADRS